MSMLGGLVNAFHAGDLRKRVLFTAFMLALYRLGAHLPVPGVNVDALERLFRQEGSVFNFLDLFVGGAFSRFAIFALGVFPYITASIIMSLLQVVFPSLKEMAQEEGEAGRRRLGMYTRYLTVVLAVLQAVGQTALIRNLGALPDARPLTLGMIVITLTAGTMLLTWMGEIMTEHGVGNGVSLLIFGGIVARLPDQIDDFGALELGLDVALVALDFPQFLLGGRIVGRLHGERLVQRLQLARARLQLLETMGCDVVGVHGQRALGQFARRQIVDAFLGEGSTHLTPDLEGRIAEFTGMVTAHVRCNSAG